ncbi:MAG: hypothetical protein OXC91_09075 [Rhodobacteraceae bacterium]|nr:hypothetical protein [Paracoccaceae bacterium]
MPEAHEIEVVLPGAANSVGSHGHPILETGNLAFPEGRYFVSLEQDPRSMVLQVSHRLKDAPLLDRLIHERKAQFACIVSAPISAYRKIHLSSVSRQEVDCDISNLGEPPLLTPAILCVCDTDIVLDSGRDGLHPIWDGRRVELKVGSRIAVGNVIQFVASITHLLSLHSDENMHCGGFAIEIESEPFGFRANLHPDLHVFLRYRTGPLRDHLMIHIVTACLARLQQDYSEHYGDGEAEKGFCRQLEALGDLLESKGLPHWSDEAFRPERVATALYPINVPVDDPASEAETCT